MDKIKSEEARFAEMQQALKDNLKAQIQNMMILRINYDDLGCGEDAPLSITIEGRPK
jgi:hypothetical protein